MSFRYTDETWRPPFADGVRAHFRVSYDPNSTIGASLYSGFVYGCTCGALGFSEDGNVLCHRYSDEALGWSSVRCDVCGGSECRPLSLDRQEKYMRASVEGGVDAVWAMVEVFPERP